MAFDPDAYLASKKQSTGFDPDAYLASKGVAPVAPVAQGTSPLGVAEAAGTMLSGALAEPIAGVAGIASIPFKGSEAGDIVRRVREALTYQPKTPEGEQALRSIAETLSPLTSALESAEKAAGEFGYEALGPVGGAIGETLPTLAGELIGAAAARGAARSAKSLTGDVPAQPAALIREAEQAGVPLMTSDVIQPETFVGKSIQQSAEKIPLVGTGPVREAQQGLRQRAVENIADKYGEYSYDAIIKSLNDKKDTIRKAAGSTLERVGNTLDPIGEVPLSNARQAITEARDVLSQPGVIKSSGALEDLQTLVDALDEPQTFTSLKENRTAFREIVDSTDKADRSQMTSRAKSLLTKVGEGLTKDMESFAKSNLSPQEFTQWKRANTVYASEAAKLTKTKLKNVLDKGDVTPESVKTMLFSQKPSEQRLLYQSLTNQGRANARAAIISKVVEDVSKRRGGLTPNAFASELRKHGSQIDTFFKGSEKGQLKGLQRVLEATYRAQEAGVTTPTGQALIPLLTGASVVANPAATAGVAGTLGGLARLYESAPVRNALLKLGSAQPNSSGYAQALLNAQLVLTAATQNESSGSQKETEQ